MLIHACLPLSLVCVGVTGLIVGHPFDTIKVKLILQCVFYVMILLLWYLVAMVFGCHGFYPLQARLQTDGLDGKVLYRGTFHCFKHMVKNEGVSERMPSGQQFSLSSSYCQVPKQ